MWFKQELHGKPPTLFGLFWILATFIPYREKVFFLPLQKLKKIFFETVILILVYTPELPGGPLQTLGAMGPLQEPLIPWGWAWV